MDTKKLIAMHARKSINSDSNFYNAGNNISFLKTISYSNTEKRPPKSEVDAESLTADFFFVGVYVIKNFRFCYVNKWLSHIFGYEDPDQLKGRMLWSVIHTADRKRVEQELNSIDAPNDNRQFSIQITKKDGSTTWVSIRAGKINYNGSLALAGHIMELPQFTELEKSFYSTRTRYNKIINEIEDAVTEVDLKGTILYTNKAAEKLWDAPADKLIGTNFQRYVDKNTATLIKRIYAELYRTGVSGKALTFEVTTSTDKKLFIEEIRSIIRDRNGVATGFQVISRNITHKVNAQKELETQRMRLKAIFNSVQDAIITVDSELNILTANLSTRQLCGIDNEKITGKPFMACMKNCGQTCFMILKETLENKTITRERHIECNACSRHHQMVSISSSPLLSTGGGFIGAVLVVRDITKIRDLERELKERHKFRNIIGKSKKMQDIYHLLEKLTNIDTTVLVTGESGTGKELVAKALHYSGCRFNKPFVAVNCSALTENLLESELFGHVKGAFTGAINDKQGRFQAANGGTIVLDEIGDISHSTQLKLLRVLQEREIERVGENTPQKIDIRIIACTNRNLKKLVEEGKFRQDLYYRLKVVEVSMPALREKKEDIPLLVDYFRSIFNKKFKKKIKGLSVNALSKFMNYSWPGNIRELEHIIERAFILCQGTIITKEHLPVELILQDIPSENNDPNPKEYVDTSSGIVTHENPVIEDVVKRGKNNAAYAQRIVYALNLTAGKKSEAAKLLGISRQTLYRKIFEFNIKTKSYTK